MKKYYKVIIIFLVIFLISANIVSIAFSRSIDKMVQVTKSNMFLNKKLPKYHFSIILHNTEEPYLKEIENGIKDETNKLNDVIEVNYTSDVDDYKETIKYMNIAIDSKVDGIVTHAFNNPEFKSLVDQAEKNNISVVLLDSDIAQSKRNAYIGVNAFAIGVADEKLVSDALKGKARVAFILDNGNDSSNIKIDGFNNGAKSNNNIKIDTVNHSELGVLGANDATQDIINNQPNVNAIVCTNSKDTIGAAQLVVDFNRVGDIIIIGYDITPEILDYIEKGVIYGTIIPNGFSIGSESIKVLNEAKKNGKIFSSINTEFKIITKDNLKDYINGKNKGGVN